MADVVEGNFVNGDFAASAKAKADKVRSEPEAGADEDHAFWINLARSMQNAHKDAGGLWMAYSAVPHGEHVIDVKQPFVQTLIDTVREQFTKAERHVRETFAAKILTQEMGHNLPFAINGEPLAIEIPDAATALTVLVSEMDWQTCADEAEAEDLAMEVAEGMLRAAERISEHSLAEDAVADAYIAKARHLPAVANLVAHDDLETAHNARLYALRILNDIRDRREPDALTEGMMCALLYWINDRILEAMKGTDVADLRKSAGLTQQRLADAIGVSRQHLVSLEKGKYQVSARLGRAIVTACRAAKAERARAKTASDSANDTAMEG